MSISEIYVHNGSIMHSDVMKYLFIILLLLPLSLSARTIVVKYRDLPVDVDNGHFEELRLKPSSLVMEMFYDEQGNYLLVSLKNTFYHYCGINKPVINTWVNSDSLGRFYLSNIKGNFDCRVYPMPSYE